MSAGMPPGSEYFNPYCNPFGPRASPRGVLRASTTLTQGVYPGQAREQVSSQPKLTSLAPCFASTRPQWRRRPLCLWLRSPRPSAIEVAHQSAISPARKGLYLVGSSSLAIYWLRLQVLPSGAFRPSFSHPVNVLQHH
jgi:hypothetical protein